MIPAWAAPKVERSCSCKSAHAWCVRSEFLQDLLNRIVAHGWNRQHSADAMAVEIGPDDKAAMHAS